MSLAPPSQSPENPVSLAPLLQSSERPAGLTLPPRSPEQPVSLAPPSRHSPYLERWRWPALVAGIVLVANVAPSRILDLVPRCPLRSLTGLLCPLCGSTRAIYHLARGEWHSAWNYNALTVLVALAWAAHVVGRSVWGERWLSVGPRARRALAMAASIAAAVFFVARNFYWVGGGSAGP